MASGIMTIVIVIVVAVAAFFGYRWYKKHQPEKQLNTFADPISQETGKQLDVLSPITKKSILG